VVLIGAQVIEERQARAKRTAGMAKFFILVLCEIVLQEEKDACKNYGEDCLPLIRLTIHKSHQKI
jgi:hypothetical protein